MAYYNVCPDCGSNLDPGEFCDCKRQPDAPALIPAEGGVKNARGGFETAGRERAWNADRRLRVV